jgi:hypothetical protein
MRVLWSENEATVGKVLEGGWLVHLGGGARPALAGAARLSAQSRRAHVAGAEVQLLDLARPVAFVSGLLRPRIYLSLPLIALLDAHELRGVMLHEYHHRRTLAPLRGLALESWQRLLGWLPAAHRTLAERVAAPKSRLTRPPSLGASHRQPLRQRSPSARWSSRLPPAPSPPRRRSGSASWSHGVRTGASTVVVRCRWNGWRQQAPCSHVGHAT